MIEDRASVTDIESKQGWRASCTITKVVETTDSKLTGKYMFKTGSINRDRHYHLIYRLKIRLCSTVAASAVRGVLRAIIPLWLCLFYCIDTATQHLVHLSLWSCNGESDVELNVLIRMYRGEDKTRGTLPIVLVHVTGLSRYAHAHLDRQKKSRFWETAKARTCRG